jgi:polar amino acid transport system substrate-binding protein
MLADYPICAVSMVRYPDAGFYTDLVKLTHEPLGIAIPSNDPHMVNWLENTLNLIKGDGTLAAVEERWFNDLSWLSKLP